jgi:hypothetical protein
MGIYTSGKIFGIKIYNVNLDDDVIHILFEEKYDDIMSGEQIREAFLFYIELNDKNNIFFKIYTECITTFDKHNKSIFMDWCPMSLNTFLENFSI